MPPSPNHPASAAHDAGAPDFEPQADGSLRIGGAALLHDIARHAAVVEHWPVLAQACDTVGSPSVDETETLGGNLCQRPRCSYFQQGVSCFKSGGDSCPAVDGDNQYLAIVNAGPCYAVHPSEPALALAALDAIVEVQGPNGMRAVPISEFFVLPAQRVDRETVVEPGEFVRAVVLPAESTDGVQYYHKLIQGDAPDFAVVSIAATKRPSGDVRLVLGGVAPAPWRVNESVELDVGSGGLDEDSIASLADRALYDAEPLSQNAYKVEEAATLLRQAMGELSA